MFRFSLETVPALACLSWSSCDWWLQRFRCCNFCSSCCWCCTCWWTYCSNSSLLVRCCSWVWCCRCLCCGCSWFTCYCCWVSSFCVSTCWCRVESYCGIKTHVGGVLRVLHVLQEALIKLVHLTDQFWSFMLEALAALSFVYGLSPFLR